MTRITEARVTAGRNDHHHDLFRALEDAALARGGIPVDTDNLHGGFRDFEHQISVQTIAREWLRANGTIASEYPVRDAYRVCIEDRKNQRGLGTDDFLGICENIASKSLTMGFENAPALYRTIARISTLNDFRQTTRAGLAPMEVLTKPGEHGEVRSALSSAVRSYITGARYAGTYIISYEALLADELDALTRPFYEAGHVTAATVDAALITMLTSLAGTGPVLADGIALFNSAHANYTESAGAPSVTTLSVGRQAMRRHKDAGTTRCLNIQPKFLLVPPALESEGRVLCAAEFVPGRDDNLECVVSPQLEDSTNGTVAWFLLASPNIHDTLDVGFIGGEAPELSSQKGWEVDGTATRIGIGFGVCALDYRGMYRKKGA